MKSMFRPFHLKFLLVHCLYSIASHLRTFALKSIYPLAYLASKAVASSIFNITVIGQLNVPVNDPLILASTHCNMVMDPAILISTVPNRRQNHYWAKKELWLSSILGFIFDGLGAIPVTRNIKSSSASSSFKNHINNSELWLATTRMLQSKEMVVVFPEGTSYTLPHLIEFKDGISKAALNYASHAVHHKLPPAHIVPVGITYLNKTEWRSQAIIIFGKPIDVTEYIGKSVRELTLHVQHHIRKVSLNAPDWDSFHAAQLAYSIIDTATISPSEILHASHRLFLNHVTDPTVAIPVLQGFIALFSDLANHALVQPVRSGLVRYHRHLRTAHVKDVTVHVLTPRKGRLVQTLAMAVLRLVVYLPVIVPGFLVYAHLFAVWFWLNRGEVYREVYAQNKGLSGLVIVPLTHVFWMYMCGWWVEPVLIWVTIVFMWSLDSFLETYETVDQIVRWAALRRDDRQELSAQRATVYADITGLVPLLPTSASFFVKPPSISDLHSRPGGTPVVGPTKVSIPLTFMNELAYNDLKYGPFKKEQSTPPPEQIPAGKFPEPEHMSMAKRPWVDVACDLMAARDWAEGRLERYSWICQGM